VTLFQVDATQSARIFVEAETREAALSKARVADLFADDVWFDEGMDAYEAKPEDLDPELDFVWRGNEWVPARDL
jgi:hypothetical protein